MSDQLVTYSLNDGIAVIRMDDGKRNALSPAMFAAINQALDRAEKDQAAVILTGRDEVFSAGFDLRVMKGGGVNALKMLHAGYSITARVLGFPRPVVAACNGHCLAMGVFLMLSCDYVIGTRGDFKVSANEVALGLTMPRVAASLLRHRLNPDAYQRAVTLSEFFNVEAAADAGFFDELADSADHLMEKAESKAAGFAELDARAHSTSKRRIRRELIRYIKRNVPLDVFDAAMFGLRGAKPKTKIK